MALTAQQLRAAADTSLEPYNLEWAQRARTLLRDAAEELEMRDRPLVHDYLEAALNEAWHQEARWGTDHDAGKTPSDWFWLAGYLLGKANAELTLATYGRGGVDPIYGSLHLDKGKHHLVTAGAALANWFAQVGGQSSMMPGVLPASVTGANPSQVPDGTEAL